MRIKLKNLGSGCDSSGRVGTSNTRSPQFKSDLKQFFIENLFAVYCIEKMKIKMEEAVNGRLTKTEGIS